MWTSLVCHGSGWAGAVCETKVTQCGLGGFTLPPPASFVDMSQRKAFKISKKPTDPSIIIGNMHMEVCALPPGGCARIK